MWPGANNCKINIRNSNMGMHFYIQVPMEPDGGWQIHLWGKKKDLGSSIIILFSPIER